MIPTLCIKLKEEFIKQEHKKLGIIFELINFDFFDQYFYLTPREKNTINRAKTRDTE